MTLILLNPAIKKNKKYYKNNSNKVKYWKKNY